MTKFAYLASLLAVGGLLVSTGSVAAQKPAEKLVEASGCVVKGVEAGCLLLVTKDGKKYNIFAKEKPALGTWIRIVGTRHDGPNICMEGIPVRVESWTKLGPSCPKRKEETPR